MATIDHVLMDDWAGLYVDGELYAEGHSIPPYVFLEVIEKLVPGTKTSTLEADPAWAESQDSLPSLLTDVEVIA